MSQWCGAAAHYVVDPSTAAAEFRRRRQPAPCRTAAAGKKFGAPPRQPKFTEAASGRHRLSLND